MAGHPAFQSAGEVKDRGDKIAFPSFAPRNPDPGVKGTPYCEQPKHLSSPGIGIPPHPRHRFELKFTQSCSVQESAEVELMRRILSVAIDSRSCFDEMVIRSFFLFTSLRSAQSPDSMALLDHYVVVGSVDGRLALPVADHDSGGLDWNQSVKSVSGHVLAE